MQKPGEQLVEFAGELRVLADRAYPRWSSEHRQEALRNQFMQGVRSSSIQLRLMKEMPPTLDDALKLASQLEAVEEAQKRLQKDRCKTESLALTDDTVADPDSCTSNATSGPGQQQYERESLEKRLSRQLRQAEADVQKLSIQVQQLLKESTMNTRRRPANSWDNTGQKRTDGPVCWGCGKKGHVKRDCPQRRTAFKNHLPSESAAKSLSQKLDSFTFHSLLSSASLVNKARMLSVSSPHASSWITAIPSTSLKLHLDSAEYQTAIRWWLGLNTSEASPCPFCPELVLDPLGHHAASCRHGGDVVTQHNRLRNIFVEVLRNTRPADVLVQDWVRGSPAIDITVTSPLTPAMLRDASTSAGSAAYAAECRKHEANDTKCQELGWTCIPLAVETFGHWGKEAQAVFSRLASFIAIHRASPKSSVLNESIVVSTCPWLRDVFAESCRRACIGVQVEAGSGLGRNEHHTRPADVLATNWMLGKPAAFDFAVTSPLNSSTLHEASVTAGSAAHATEARKHQANDVKCAELGWVSIPVVVETYGCWGTEAKWALSQLALD
ncbi:hypothetical protein EMCRGX_G003208 [Ephydatia muelleri]